MYGAAEPQPNPGVLEITQNCRDGTGSRLYGALLSLEIRARQARIYSPVARRAIKSPCSSVSSVVKIFSRKRQGFPAQ